MKAILRLVFNRWTLLAVLLLALSLAIWFGGPLLQFNQHPVLESESSRWAAIGAIVGATLLVAAWNAWRARRGNSAVVDKLVAAPAPGPIESADMQAVRERFAKALQLLRRVRFGGGGVLEGWRARMGGRYLYELPWYVIIGAPGSGKTTALCHSGLRFPLADAMGDPAVEGFGGTRHCDWWFTDQAVLIDTAGRFTTQDSDRENDRRTWSGFLALLKQTRPRQPLNGVLIAVSVSDLLTASASERAQHAATVRRRLQEVHEGLRIRLPIYLLITKCDLMAGFMDYFANVDRDQREAAWGFTFDDPAGGHDPKRVASELEALLGRLHDGVVDRLQAERDLRRRAAIYAFPGQFAGLVPLVQAFLDAVFSSSTFDIPPQLRGVYFVSGTQEGTPLDRTLGSIARTYRLERAVVSPNRASGKSYFLARLLGEVVFAESGLAGTDTRWERRRSGLAAGGYAALLLLACGAFGAWGLSAVNNLRFIAQVAAREDDVRKQVARTPNLASADLQPLLPALDATRSLAQADVDGSVPWSLGFGLYQGRKLDAAARQAYERMLVDAVEPRLAMRVEDQLRAGGELAESRYEALKTYVMMRDMDHFDAQALKAYFEHDWDAQFGRNIGVDERRQLSEHLDALLAQGPVASPIAEDKALVESVRSRMASVSLAQRIYQRMRQAGVGSEFPDFTLARIGGPNATLVFASQGQRPPTKGVPGLFTWDGYHKGFERNVEAATKQLASEQPWVLGIANPAPTLPGNAGFVDGVRRLYLAEYAAAWQDFLADLRLQPAASLDQTTQLARLLAQPDGALPLVLKGASRETTLTGGDVGLLERAQIGTVKKITKAITDVTGTKPPFETGEASEKALVDDKFASLRSLVTAAPGGKAPLDETQAVIGELYVHLNAVQAAIAGGAPPPASPLPNQLVSVAAQMPEPLRSMLGRLGGDAGSITQLRRREQFSREVKAQIGDLCRLGLAGRYPLDRRSAVDAPLADFARVFGPNGAFQKEMQGPLGQQIDTSTPTWSFRPIDGAPLGAGAGQLPQFQRAAAIRDAFFGAGDTVSLQLDFKPVDMDPTLTQFVLDVDGQIVRYSHGPQLSTTVRWPGPGGRSEVRVQVTPTGASGSGIVESGPWALFRMFDRVRIEPGPTPARERFRATFDLDGRKAVFDVTTSSVRNPFRLQELSQFACPTGV